MINTIHVCIVASLCDFWTSGYLSFPASLVRTSGDDASDRPMKRIKLDQTEIVTESDVVNLESPYPDLIIHCYVHISCQTCLSPPNDDASRMTWFLLCSGGTPHFHDQTVLCISRLPSTFSNGTPFCCCKKK